jgi:hypothetical protein
MRSMPKRSPKGWDQHELLCFFDLCRDNQFASYVVPETRELVQKLLAIDSAHHLALDDWRGSTSDEFYKDAHQFAALMLIRSHSAFRSAAMVAMSGMVTETFVLARTTVEWAAYACRITENETAFHAWIDREDNETTQRKCRNEFSYKKLLESLNKTSNQLIYPFESIYKTAINYGAHPNVFGAFAGMATNETDREFSLTAQYLHPPKIELKLAQKTVCRAGFFPLAVMSFIFPKRLAETSVAERMSDLSSGL